jgi:hypothetical protein
MAAVLVSYAPGSDTRPECVSLESSLSSGRFAARALQNCSDRFLAEPDM